MVGEPADPTKNDVVVTGFDQGMGVAFERGQCAINERQAVVGDRTGHTVKAVFDRPGHLLGHMLLVVREDIDDESTLLADDLVRR